MFTYVFYIEHFWFAAPRRIFLSTINEVLLRLIKNFKIVDEMITDTLSAPHSQI